MHACIYTYVPLKKITREGGRSVVVVVVVVGGAVVATRHTMDTIGTMNDPAKLPNIG